MMHRRFFGVVARRLRARVLLLLGSVD